MVRRPTTTTPLSATPPINHRSGATSATTTNKTNISPRSGKPFALQFNRPRARPTPTQANSAWRRRSAQQHDLTALSSNPGCSMGRKNNIILSNKWFPPPPHARFRFRRSKESDFVCYRRQQCIYANRYGTLNSRQSVERRHHSSKKNSTPFSLKGGWGVGGSFIRGGSLFVFFRFPAPPPPPPPDTCSAVAHLSL